MLHLIQESNMNVCHFCHVRFHHEAALVSTLNRRSERQKKSEQTLFIIIVTNSQKSLPNITIIIISYGDIKLTRVCIIKITWTCIDPSFEKMLSSFLSSFFFLCFFFSSCYCSSLQTNTKKKVIFRIGEWNHLSSIRNTCVFGKQKYFCSISLWPTICT